LELGRKWFFILKAITGQLKSRISAKRKTK
jgi:hypothetical protein